MSLIRKPAQLVVPSTLKALIYGQPGISKTTLALSAPRPLLMDFDKGVHRVAPQHRTDTYQVESWDGAIEVFKEDLTAYDTLVCDTAGKLLDYLTNFLIKEDPKLGKKDGALTLQGYGARRMAFRGFLRMAESLGKHVIFVAHELEERNGDEKFIRPEVGASSGADLIKELDLVGYMEAIGKKRTISFDPCEKFYGKNSCRLPSIIELPNVLEPGVKNDLMTTIIAKYKEEQEKRHEVGVAYTAVLKEIEIEINAAKNAEELNTLVPTMAERDHIWDSKLQASYLMKAQATALGLKWSKEAGGYIPVENKAEIPEGDKDGKPAIEKDAVGADIAAQAGKTINTNQGGELFNAEQEKGTDVVPIVKITAGSKKDGKPKVEKPVATDVPDGSVVGEDFAERRAREVLEAETAAGNTGEGAAVNE